MGLLETVLRQGAGEFVARDLKVNGLSLSCIGRPLST